MILRTLLLSFCAGVFAVYVHVYTNRQVGEDTEGALQKGDEVNQVVTGIQTAATLHWGHPVVVG